MSRDNDEERASYGTKLLTKDYGLTILKKPMANRINFKDLYTFYNDFDASIAEALVEENNITFSMRTLGSSRYSTDTSDFGERLLAVEEERVDAARKILSDAIRNGTISDEGSFRD